MFDHGIDLGYRRGRHRVDRRAQPQTKRPPEGGLSVALIGLADQATLTAGV
jgi:hypothetical protein